MLLTEVYDTDYLPRAGGGQVPFKEGWLHEMKFCVIKGLMDVVLPDDVENTKGAVFAIQIDGWCFAWMPEGPGKYRLVSVLIE